MLRLRLPTILLISALGLGLMGGVLLAQQPEDTVSPAPINCSPEGLDALMQEMDKQFPVDFAANPKEATASLYRRGLVYQQIALECGYAPSADEVNLTVKVADVSTTHQAQSVGDDPVVALAQITDLAGDPVHGATLFKGEARSTFNTVLGCSACHAPGSVGPADNTIWDRTLNKRLTQPLFTGYTAEHYLVESIITPESYVVPGFVVTMPTGFGDKLSPQDLADVVAYLHSLSTTDAPTTQP